MKRRKVLFHKLKHLELDGEGQDAVSLLDFPLKSTWFFLQQISSNVLRVRDSSGLGVRAESIRLGLGLKARRI